MWPSQRGLNYSLIMLPSENKTPPKFPNSPLCSMLTTVSILLIYRVYSPEFHVITRLSLTEGRAGAAQEPPEQQTSLTPPTLWQVNCLSVHNPFCFYFVAIHKHSDKFLESLHVSRSWSTHPPTLAQKIFVHTKIINVSNKGNWQ
jgi:hypothetical protein